MNFFLIEPSRNATKRTREIASFFFIIICFCLLCKTFSNLLLAAPLITGCQRPLLPHLLKLISLVFPFFY
jgi:hypothetical protein